VHAFSQRLRETQLDLDVQSTGVGEFDGLEIGDGQYILSFRAPDVDRLIAELHPLLRRSPLCDGGHLVRMVQSDTGRWERKVAPI